MRGLAGLRCCLARSDSQLWAQTLTYDYKRNGTTNLFAALNAANGKVYGLCQQKHRHREWLRFLRRIDRTVPADKGIYLICDNYATHKHARAWRWLDAQALPCRFTPTSACWFNIVERFFRDLTHNRLQRGVFQDLEQLIAAIGSHIDGHNKPLKPSSGWPRQTTSWKRSPARRVYSMNDESLET
jgi:transposase